MDKERSGRKRSHVYGKNSVQYSIFSYFVPKNLGEVESLGDVFADLI